MHGYCRKPELWCRASSSYVWICYQRGRWPGSGGAGVIASVGVGDDDALTDMAVQVKAAFIAAKHWRVILAMVAVMALLVPLLIALLVALVLGVLDDVDEDQGSGMVSGLAVVVPRDQIDTLTQAAQACQGEPAALAATIATFPSRTSEATWPINEIGVYLDNAGLLATYGGEGADPERPADVIKAIGSLWCTVLGGLQDWANDTDDLWLTTHVGVWVTRSEALDGVNSVMDDIGHHDTWLDSSQVFATWGTDWISSANSMGLFLATQQIETDEQLETTGPGVSADGTYRVSKAGSGRLDTSTLCPILGNNTWLLRCDAARALDQFNAAYKAQFGRNMAVCGATCAYRDYAAQVRTKQQSGSMAATPGLSNHGWGLAADFTPATHGGSEQSAEYRWMRANSRQFGWDHPSWARSGGSKPEIWHWEYIGA
ncbi:D-alanyl-D-alanine carboxypeptidase [Micrococcales bacterium KH10]|nr:D-alanyl-D-alanine carboxypeptidase [Micrococcales bacterium KH10]